jgi:phosphoribosylaminoimidazolecarboxamide formyltransferase/IMP cyclohydrolase
VFNSTVDEDLARLIVETERNVEVVYAPGFTTEGLEILATRKPLRVVQMGPLYRIPPLMKISSSKGFPVGF